MSGRRLHLLEIRRCACGRIPGVNQLHAGEERVFSVSCACGAETEWSSHDDALSLWNDGALKFGQPLKFCGWPFGPQGGFARQRGGPDAVSPAGGVLPAGP